VRARQGGLWGRAGCDENAILACALWRSQNSRRFALLQFVKPPLPPIMPQPEKKIPVPSATLDVSVQYKDEFLNNCVVQLFNAEGTYYSGRIDLGDTGKKSIIVTQTMLNLTLRVTRAPKAPQDDSSKYPVLSGDYPLGPVMENTKVAIVVGEPPM